MVDSVGADVMVGQGTRGIGSEWSRGLESVCDSRETPGAGASHTSPFLFQHERTPSCPLCLLATGLACWNWMCSIRTAGIEQTSPALGLNRSRLMSLSAALADRRSISAATESCSAPEPSILPIPWGRGNGGSPGGCRHQYRHVGCRNQCRVGRSGDQPGPHSFALR